VLLLPARTAHFGTGKPEYLLASRSRSLESLQLYCDSTMELTTCKEEEQFLHNTSRSRSKPDLELAVHCAGLGLSRWAGKENFFRKWISPRPGGRKRDQTNAGNRDAYQQPSASFSGVGFRCTAAICSSLIQDVGTPSSSRNA
jgi:hypothetical protein